LISVTTLLSAAIDDLKDAMEGMLAPEMKEEILGTAEIRDI
jgi:translation initiation factor IF-2